MFPSMILTKLGEKLLNKAIAEKKVLKFTKIKIGSGDVKGNQQELIELVNPFKTVPILSTEIQSDNIVKIKGYFDNNDVQEDIEWKEIGVYCQIGDESLTEILYSYSNSSPEKVIIPKKVRGDFERTLDIRNYIGSATKVTFNITEVADTYNFNTIEEMKVATYLKLGDKVGLWGRDKLGDTNIRLYIIRKEAGKDSINLSNGLYANLYFTLDKTSDYKAADINKVFTQAGANSLYKEKYDKTGGEINGSVVINTTDDSHSFVIQNPNFPARNNRMVFGFRNNVARIRLYGGSKEIRDNGFNIEGDNNKILFRVDNDGNILEKGTDKVLTLKTKEFLGNAGLSSVDYIQTPGKKYKDLGYTDRDTGRLYLCINQTTDTTVTENFKLATNLELAKYIQITNIYKSGDWIVETYSNNFKRMSLRRAFTGSLDRINFPIRFNDENSIRWATGERTNTDNPESEIARVGIANLTVDGFIVRMNTRSEDLTFTFWGF